jgi:hypothetical protein
MHKGFGYLNEQGELVFWASGISKDSNNDDNKERFVRSLYPGIDNKFDGNDSTEGNGNMEHDSNDKGHNGNDYPDNKYPHRHVNDDRDTNHCNAKLLLLYTRTIC